MAEVKLKADKNADTYGSIPLDENFKKEKNVGFFDRFRSPWNYKKLNDQEIPKKKLPSFFSLFRYSDRQDKIALVIGTTAAILQGIAMTYVYVLLSSIFIAILEPQNDTTDNLNSSTAGPVGRKKHVWKHLPIFIYIGIASFVLGYLKAICFTYSSERQTGRIRILLYRTILNKSISYFDTHSPGELSSMLSGYVDKMVDGMGMKLALNIMTLSHLISSIIIAIISSWQIAVVIICLTPPLFVIGPITGKKLSSLAHSELAAYSKADAIAQEVFSSIRTVFAYNAQDNERKRYADTLSDTRNFAQKKARLSGLQVGLTNLMTYIIYGVAVIVSAVLVNHRQVTIGHIITAFLTAGRGSFYAVMLLPQFQALNEARGAAQRLWQFINESESKSNIQGKTLVSLASGISFEDVSFAYPSRTDVSVLNTVSFRVNQGETVAIVGSSGSGKSTCVQLLLRFYDPVSGCIRVNDGNPIEEIDVESYRQQIAVVGQEPVLFATTIRENIQYGNDLASFADIENAARQANAHDFIMGLPKNYDTVVGQRGTQLSGGEKQRVCLARALVKHAPILLLDEATSALDTRSEAIVQKALDQACRDGQRTTLMITHRLSTVKYADRIIVMRKGAVVEQGTHQELIKIEGGLYASMMTRQENSEDNDNNKGEEGDEQLYGSLKSSVSESSHRKRTATTQDQSNQLPPEDKDQLHDKPMSTYRVIWELSRSAWRWLLFGCLASAIVSLRTLVWTYLLGMTILGLGEPTNAARLHSLLIVSLSLLALGIIVCVACWCNFYCIGRASAQLTEELRLRTFATLLQQEIGWFDRKENGSGQLSKLLENDAATIQTTIGSVLTSFTEVIVTLASGIILAGILLGWKITVVFIALIILLTFICFLYTKLSKYVATKKKQILTDLNMMAIESTQNIRTVFELNRQKSFTDKYTSLSDQAVKIPLKYMHLVGVLCGIEMSRIFFLMAIVLVLVVSMADNGEMTVPRMILTVSFGSFINQTYTLAYIALPKLGSSFAVAYQFEQLFQRKPRIFLDTSTESDLPIQLEKIEFDHVKFSYPTRPLISVLNNLNLKVESGQSIALVGTTGCGKSTILALIERFYDVIDGEVRLNSRNVNHLNLKRLRSSIGYVGQEPVLFNMSIRDNITYGNDQKSLTLDDVIEAATSANINSFIQALPEGYDTSIGQFGNRISGGERQRLAIARALARKPQLLLMDEPTSALDNENEQLIQEELRRTSQNFTSITVAHRLSTIRHADTIFVMQGGHVVESGKHDALMAKPNGFYARLYNHSIRSTSA